MRRPLAVIAAAFAIALAIAFTCIGAISQSYTLRSTAQSSAPTTDASAPQAQYYRAEPDPWQPSDYKEEVKATKALKAWGTGKERLHLFNHVDKAQFLIAKAIESGKLGDVERYDYDGVPWPDNEEGWGVLIVRDPYGSADEVRNRAMAEVYFRKHGVVDHSWGVPNASIDLGQKYLGVQIMDESMSPDVRYNVFLDTSMDFAGAQLSSCFEFCSVSIYGTDGRYTTWDVNQLIGWEKLALSALDQNLTSLYGPKWRAKPLH